MTLNLSVRDYRGIERADVTLSPIALVAGMNEQGKSSLAEAARAALAGLVIPVPGVTKKAAALLVRDGAQEGQSKVTDGELSRSVRWPKCALMDGDKGIPFASPFAVGARHLFDLDDKERPSVLSGYVDSVPTVSDLAAAMTDIGYGKEAVGKVWNEIEKPSEGWDGVWRSTRDYGVKVKGAWEQIAGEKYGAKKAAEWKPEGWPGADATRELLQAAIDAASTKVKAAIGESAVSAADLERLRTEAAEVPDATAALRKSLEEAQAELTEAEAERLALPSEEAGDNVVPCPACHAELVVETVWKGPTTLKVRDAKAAKSAATKETRSRRAALDGLISNLKDRTIPDLAQRIARADTTAERVDAARARLAEIEGQQADSDAVAAAEAEEAAARAALAAFDAKIQADQLHARIVKNEALLEVLAPDGLRQRKLVQGLESANEALAAICDAAKWPVVRIDENLDPHYGTRPVWAASRSGQWRARVVVQIAMAQMDTSAAIVIDEADILDVKGRNGLFLALKASGLRALVCMTVNKPDLVPDLARVGLGASYWCEAGVVEPIARQEAQAA